MYLFNEHLNNAFSKYSGSNPLDWLHNFSRHHQVKPNTGLFHLNARDEAGYTLTDYLTHDQLFNGSAVTRAIAEYWADSPDEIKRLVESTIRGGGFGDDLEEMGLNSMSIRQEQKNQAYLFKHNHSLRIGFFLNALGCASDYREELNELLNQLRIKAHENKRADSDEEHELLNQIRETDKKLGVLSEFERHASTEHIVRQMATNYHAPAVQAEPTPKGSGGNTRRTKHKQGLAKRLIHELFEQYPDKSGGEICGLLESQKFQLDGWRVERHVGSVTEPDNIKKDKYIIESDQGTDRVTAGTIDTWLSNYRKKVK